MEIKSKLFVISGPSGAGKGTLVTKLLKRLPDLHFSISLTTRKPRSGELPGIDYHFVSEEEFLKKIESNEFLEWAKVHDHYYGTLYEPIKRNLKAGKDVILEIDVQGALQVKKKVPDSILIFISPPSVEELKTRLQGRKTETGKAMEVRIQDALRELKQAKKYDYEVINDEVDKATRELIKIIQSERGGTNGTCLSQN